MGTQKNRLDEMVKRTILISTQNMFKPMNEKMLSILCLPFFAYEALCNISHIILASIDIASFNLLNMGVQWLSGRVLDSRLRGRGFEPHWRHCVVVLEQDTFILA